MRLFGVASRTSIRGLGMSFWLVVVIGSVTSCRDSRSPWVPNEQLLAEIVTIDPETDPARAGAVASQFFDDAVTDSKTGVELTGPNRAERFREAFDVFRRRLGAGGDVAAGFNACFPGSFVIPKASDVSDVSELIKRGWQCQLIQRNGPSVAKLRKDPLVAKYLDANGNLVAPADIELMHQDLNGAYSRRNPQDSQKSLYGEARSTYKKVVNAWER
jgi:hypothetical protein